MGVRGQRHLRGALQQPVLEGAQGRGGGGGERGGVAAQDGVGPAGEQGLDLAPGLRRRGGGPGAGGGGPDGGG
ncbi:hypothetical protein LO771_04475 [Streptacidiphilus sp. ASG 303]|uniref:hypothetical protein n=1 Tax=Streptacidiphilus sp. ASG 303 TaxID=2896847 RepID=UPI001E4267A7|nr:hypothetical protein [Streptacidiphilus sp. ASG 303]MCD0481685.1 hypothetical protein [Streptacidiphilus sp. ASG 303]